MVYDLFVYFYLFFCVSHFRLTNFRFDRDWKKIEAFVGSKTVIQVFIIEVIGNKKQVTSVC